MSEFSAKEARRAEALKAQQEKKKMMMKTYIVLAALLLLVLFVVLFNSSFFYNATTAVNVNGAHYTVADFNYNYFSVYSNYYSSVYSTYGIYASYFGLLPSTSTSFREQTYSGDVTWADYFEEAAKERMTRVTMLVNEAQAAGFTLTQEDQDAIDEDIAALKAQAAENGFSSFKSYLTYVYGKGMTEKIYRENMVRDALASSYSASMGDSFTYTADEIAAHYAEHKDEYDYILYRYYFISGNAVTDDEETEEDETLSLEDAMAKAKETADALVAASTSEQGYLAYVTSLNEETEDYDADSVTYRATQGSSLSAAISEWLLDASRKAGDVTAIVTDDDATSHGYYVLYFLDRDDNRYDALDGYYAIVAPVEDLYDADDFDTDEEYQLAVQEATELSANVTLHEYTGGDDLSYEGFVGVIEGYADTFEEYGELAGFGKYSLPDSMTDWFYDPARQEGDTAVVYDEDYGAIILYYVGSEGVYADLLAESVMRSDDYNAWEDGLLENYTLKTHWQVRLATKISALGG